MPMHNPYLESTHLPVVYENDLLNGMILADSNGEVSFLSEHSTAHAYFLKRINATEPTLAFKSTDVEPFGDHAIHSFVIESIAQIITNELERMLNPESH